MQEDLFEREIKRFGQLLLKITGLLERNMLSEAAIVIEENYDEKLIADFIENDFEEDEKSLLYKKLLFNADLLYNRILILKKQNQPCDNLKNQYLSLSKKLILSGKIFDYSL